ncbi:MAG: M48 family peptidase, partial [Clostridiales bacterium]|nr:M48 family peptidase [Clostridiales bacterium]
MQTQTTIAGIPVTINKNKGQKNLYIRVKPPEGDVVISAPYRMSRADIEKFFVSKLPEIEAS